jgi:Ser/Thr protein kinase RdoA (MazF antagonist)
MDSVRLADLAGCFALDGPVRRVEPLGNGNVNTTYRVETSAGSRYVLQRLNTAVFAEPERVMANLVTLARHASSRLALLQLPLPVPLSTPSSASSSAPSGMAGPRYLHHQDGGAWRMLTHIDGAHSLDVLGSVEQAVEVGRALGRFHVLVHDLPAEQLADTLEGFHQTPVYHRQYRQLLLARQHSAAAAHQRADLQELWCQDFIAAREDLVPVLEQARAQGRLQLRPIHGDPKVNNVMLCTATGCAVAMVDLDTVKPGLLHYDIGDALRSGCNPAGEETTDLEAVHFDLALAEAMLRGYLGEAASLLSADDIAHLYDAIRLLPFELGLRFFSDHLAGNTYFTVSHGRHNLNRALVQFRLTESIEARESAIRALITHLLAGTR